MHAFQIKLGFFLVLILLFSNSIFGQGWEKEYPISITNTGQQVTNHQGFLAITKAINGDYIVTSNNLTLASRPEHISIHRINANGNEVWQKNYLTHLFAFGLPFRVERLRSIKKIIPTTDSSYLLLINRYNQTSSQRTEIELLKINEQGDSLWHYQYYNTLQAKDHAVNIIATADGGCLIAGTQDDIYNGDTAQRERGAVLIKIDAQGQQQWKKIYATHPTVHNTLDTVYPLTSAIDILELANNNYLLLATQGIHDNLNLPFADTSVIFKIDETGQLLQQYIYPGHTLKNMLHSSNQQFWVTDYTNNHLYLSKLDILGNIVFTSPNALDTAHNINNLHSLTWSSDGQLLALHNYASIGLASAQKTAIVKLDTVGNLIWDKRDTSAYNKYSLAQLIPSVAKGAVAVGFRLAANTGNGTMSKPFTIQVDSAGQSKTNLIYGYVAKDSNLNCAIDSNELYLHNWIVKMTKWGQSYYTNSNSQGYYEFLTDTGDYSIEIFPPSAYWLPCSSFLTGTFANPKDTVAIDFPIQAQFDCPLLQVDLSTPLLRRCFSNRYTVSYCNEGTVTTHNPYVEITLDPYLTIDSTSIPYTSQNGNTYTFPINDVEVNDCGQFYIYANVDCDSTVLGQTHCSEAHIFPDSICINAPAWDGSDIQVSTTCLGDSIYFLIRNVGTGAMATARNYWIAEDHIMMLMNTYNLGFGQSTQIVIPATGKTYRLEVEQDQNHPLRSIAAANIERCGQDSTGTGLSTSLGIIGQYSADDQSPFVAIDCQQNVGSWDPNDKQAFPRGYGSSHYINQNQDLEYKIRFQNTGTDTAFNVVVLDTISPLLDISSLIVGASSHPYTWELLGSNIVKFNFANIILADSNVNEVASHGFINFKIKQNYNNPLGSVIENQAAIYFDFNAPVLTNTTFHTVGEDFITLSITKVVNHQTIIEAKIYPNPMQSQATVEINSNELKNIQFQLYNTMGQLVYEKQTSKNNFQINVKNLSQGVYMYTLEGDAQRIQTGRIIIQ